MSDTQTLGDIADLVRAKNAGPFWLTLDIFLNTDTDYQRVTAPGVLDQHIIADLYRIPAEHIRIFQLPNLRVVKISFPRPVTQGSFTDRDMHAGQQHIPLSTLPIPA